MDLTNFWLDLSKIRIVMQILSYVNQVGYWQYLIWLSFLTVKTKEDNINRCLSKILSRLKW